MKMLTKIIGLLLIVFTITFFQAEPIQKRHHHGPYKKHYHRGSHKIKYKKVVYYKAPKYHKKHYYRPARPRHYVHKKYRRLRVYHSRPVVIVNL